MRFIVETILIGLVVLGSVFVGVKLGASSIVEEIKTENIDNRLHLLPTQAPVLAKKQTEVHSSIVQLFALPSNRFVCSGVVIDNNHVATAGHCIPETEKGSPAPEFLLNDIRGNPTGVKVKAVGIGNRIDWGLLRGDLSSFKKMEMESDNHGFIGVNGKYVACGFPMGQKRLTCVPFEFIGTVGFEIMGRSGLIPGMSGGPVINVLTNKVVGVNSAMTLSGGMFGGNIEPGYAIVAPTLGFRGYFKIEE